MKLFDLNSLQFKQILNKGILNLTTQSCTLIITICKNLRLNLQACHYALWVFHANAIIMTYKNFDRFVYLCAAINVGMKLGQCLVYTKDIVKECRLQLKKIKGNTSQDTQQLLQRYKKKVMQAQINIMINIGFDFDIRLALTQLSLIKKDIKDSHLIIKIQQMITSFYKTQIVTFYSPQQLLLTAIEIVTKNEGININLLQLPYQIVDKLKDPKINEIKKAYFERCNID